MVVNEEQGELASPVQCMEVNLVPENQEGLRNVNFLKEEDVVTP